ncbi:MAG TPA: hypothetical protein VJ984_08070 [Xanthomonadales bacterium]|nr:hypothetical protein [Xanthomonadales bacterium]
MKKIDLGQTIGILANLGVIAGIVFLAVELHQNNELLEMEAQAVMSKDLQDGWDRISSDPDLVNLFIKDRNEEPLTEAEMFRLNAYWMGYLLRQEWQFLHVPNSGGRVTALQRIHSAYPSFRRTWNGNSEGSRAAGKDNFTPEFIEYFEQSISQKP